MSALIPLPTALRRPEGPESTTYFPKPGRTPPARLQVVPPLEEERTVYVRSDGKARWKDIAQLRGDVAAAKPRIARSVAPGAAHRPGRGRPARRGDRLASNFYFRFRITKLVSLGRW